MRNQDDEFDKIGQELMAKQAQPTAPTLDSLPALLQSYSQGQAPDFNALLQMRQGLNVVPEKPAEKFNLKNVLSYVGDALASAAKADRENPGQGLLSALAGGSAGAYEKRNEKHKAKYAGNEKIMNDMLKIAEDQRKYQQEQSKIDKPEFKFSPQGELVRFDKGYPSGTVGYSGMPINQPVRATAGGAGGQTNNPTSGGMDNTIIDSQAGKPALTGIPSVDAANQKEWDNQKIAKHTRATIGIETNEQQLRDMAPANQAIVNMRSKMKDLPTGILSPIAEAGSKVSGIWGGGKSASAAEFFRSQALPAIGLQIKTFGPQISDADRETVFALTQNPKMEKQTIEDLLNCSDAMIQEHKNYTKAKRAYLTKRGNVDDFDVKWKELVDAFPFLENKDGKITINSKNLSDETWKKILDPEFDAMIKQHGKTVPDGEQPVENYGAPDKPTYQGLNPGQPLNVHATPSANPFVNMSQEERDAYRAKLQGNK